MLESCPQRRATPKQGISEQPDKALLVGREQVVEALERAGAVIGEHERLEVRLSDQGKSLRAAYMAQPLFRKNAAPSCHWTLNFLLSEEDGKIRITSQIDEYRVFQDKLLGFIPASPARLAGRREYLAYLDAVEGELRALDPSGEVVQRQPV